MNSIPVVHKPKQIVQCVRIALGFVPLPPLITLLPKVFISSGRMAGKKSGAQQQYIEKRIKERIK